MPSILVLTNDFDEHADHVIPLLRARGATVHRFDPAELLASASLTLALGDGRPGRFRITGPDLDLRLEDISAIWYRRPKKAQAPEHIANQDWRSFIAAETEFLMRDLYRCLPAAWFPAAPHRLRDLHYRLFQLQTAAELGFDVPDTLTTTDPAAFFDFYRRHGGRVVSKLISSVSHHPFMADAVVYADLIPARDLVHVHTIRSCPTLFQQYVEKRTELRVTVVDDQIFAAEIHSQASNRTRVDWRRYDLTHTPHLPVKLPAAVERRCLAIVQRLELRYGAIDLIHTTDDRYVFLEINPNGQYLWIEQNAGLPITDAICRALMTAPPTATMRVA